MKSLQYYWDRRNVVQRTAKNLLKWGFREPLRPRGKKGEKAIVFVCQNARARIFNIAYPLRHTENIRTILLSKVFEYGFQARAFDEIHFFRNYSDLEKKIARLDRRYELLAAIGTTEPIRQSRVLIDMRADWPTMIDQFDSYWSTTHFAGMNIYKDERCKHIISEVEEEEYCFRKADGVIARTGELPLLFKELAVPTPTMLFEDGCNSIYFQNMISRPGSKNRQWSVVYPGIFYPMSLDPKLHGSNQLVPFGKLFKDEKIHFHLYPSPIHDYQYPQYEAEAASNPYFHIHASVDFDKVHTEISQYDFGWFANNYHQYGFTSEVYRKYAVATKICTYLEAGLPFISNGQNQRSADLIQKTGCGILVDDYAPKGLRETITNTNLSALLDGVKKAREEMDVNRKSGELMDFINDIRDRFFRFKSNS
jgi:hypothetical protein